MLRALLAIAVALPLLAWAPAVPTAAAQDQSRELAQALSRLKNNPAYRGRILGTYVRRSGSSYLYEVRILRPDDRVIVVYIDPRTGGVVGDSRQGGANREQRKRRQKNRKNRRN
jgi:hypothetical protein